MANKVTENKATNVKGSTNNVGQEIVKQAPTTEVVNCTMTEEEHKARVERITTKMEQGLKLSWDIIVDITTYDLTISVVAKTAIGRPAT